MSELIVTFVGSGDAFGSGGRLQTCILVDTPGIRFGVEFGTTSLVGLRKLDIDPNSIDAILLTHLHGDLGVHDQTVHLATTRTESARNEAALMYRDSRFGQG